MRIAEIKIFHILIPFKESFRHALADRRVAENVVVRIKTDEGIDGYGECVPREYVTGETVDSVMRAITHEFAPLLWPQKWKTSKELCAFLSELGDSAPAARCAVELALLDAAGRTFGYSAAEVLGWEGKARPVTYSGVISSGTLSKIARKAFLMRLYGLRNIKLKAGDADDTEKIKRVRKMVGPDADLRLDANGAWTAATAIKKIEEWKGFGISCVEQPVPKDDLEGMKEVTAAVDVDIVADESFCTLEEARRLADIRGCDILNIRLSKCGGLMRARQILELAVERGMEAQLGCQVGETAILSCAGRIFAQFHPELRYVEGSYERFLLREDLSRKRVRFHRGGIGEPIKGLGLGIVVVPEVLDRLTIGYWILERG